MEFVKEHKDVIVIGNPGTGKTFLAKCIAYGACNANIKVLFTTAIDMINHLIAAEADRSLLKKLHYYQSPALLICDELGYLSLGQQGSHLFFQVISARHQVKSTLLTTNLLCGAPHNRFVVSTFTSVFLLVVVILVALGVIKLRDEKKRIIGPGWLIALAVVVGLFLMLIIAATALSADGSRFTFPDEVTVVHLKTPIKYEDTKITVLETTQPLSGDEQWVFITDLSGREWMIPIENIAFTVKESRFVLAE